MVPKPQDHDLAIGKDIRSLPIVNLPEPIIVAAAIQFDRELCRRTIKIEYETADWMLPTKFVSGKVPVSQMPP